MTIDGARRHLLASHDSVLDIIPFPSFNVPSYIGMLIVTAAAAIDCEMQSVPATRDHALYNVLHITVLSR